jgi:hypothetical protein
MLESANDDKMKSFARAVASGRSSRSWAKEHRTDVELADEWRALPEFVKLVETHRLRAADRLTGRLLTRSTVAIDEIFRAVEHSPSYPGKLTAGRMLVNDWLRVSLRFEASRKLDDFRARMAVFEQEQQEQQSKATGITY